MLKLKMQATKHHLFRVLQSAAEMLEPEQIQEVILQHQKGLVAGDHIYAPGKVIRSGGSDSTPRCRLASCPTLSLSTAARAQGACLF